MVLGSAASDGPSDELPLPHLRRELDARFGQIVREDERGPAGVRAVLDENRGARERDTGVDRGDVGVVPLRRHAKVNVRHDWPREVDVRRQTRKVVCDRHGAEALRNRQERRVLRVLRRVQRRIGPSDVEVVGDERVDSRSAPRDLIVDLHARQGVVLRRPRAHQREGETRTRPIQLNRGRAEPEPVRQGARDHDDDGDGDDADDDPQPASALLRLECRFVLLGALHPLAPPDSDQRLLGYVVSRRILGCQLLSTG